ncbi:hypothetical protein, partial [Paraburkholderia caribensis]|uniref:hypothetical protein n=1 Tax=Paraburkholderia caribensis TaxID=75105 RepID=UPI0031D60514
RRLRRSPQRRPAQHAPRRLIVRTGALTAPGTHWRKSAASRKTDVPASVFFRPGRYFTMRKNFLRRKKSCCTAQQALLQHGKFHFLL